MFLSQLNHKSNSPGKILCNQFTLIWQHNYLNTSLHEFPRHREEAGELHTVFKYFILEGTHFVSAQSSFLRLITQSQAKCMESQRMLSPEYSRMENEMSCREVTGTIQFYSLFFSSLETNTQQKHHKREKDYPTYYFRHFGQQWQRECGTAHAIEDRKQNGTATERDKVKIYPNDHASQDPLSPTRTLLHLPQLQYLWILENSTIKIIKSQL